ncbi:hypothetical protein O4J55_28665, partial [Paracoccus sp. PXZ]
LCKLQTAGGCHDTDILAICTDQADFGDSDALVDAGAGVTGGRSVMRSAGYGCLPYIAGGLRG